MNKTTKYIKQLMATTDQEVTGLNPVGVTGEEQLVEIQVAFFVSDSVGWQHFSKALCKPTCKPKIGLNATVEMSCCASYH